MVLTTGDLNEINFTKILSFTNKTFGWAKTWPVDTHWNFFILMIRVVHKLLDHFILPLNNGTIQSIPYRDSSPLT